MTLFRKRGSSAQIEKLGWEEATHKAMYSVDLGEVLRSQSPSGKCAKLHTVAASNNRDHMPWSLLACASMFNRSNVTISRDYMPRSLLLLVRATHIWVLFFAHIPFVVNRTFNATLTERLQQQRLALNVTRIAISRTSAHYFPLANSDKNLRQFRSVTTCRYYGTGRKENAAMLTFDFDDSVLSAKQKKTTLCFIRRNDYTNKWTKSYNFEV